MLRTLRTTTTAAGFTLLELLLFLGIVAVLGALLYHVFAPSGGSPTVPGADAYVQNVTNAENIITQLGLKKPEPQLCEVLRSYFTNAEQGFNNMQSSGKVGVDAVRVAKERLDKIKSYLQANCAG